MNWTKYDILNEKEVMQMVQATLEDGRNSFMALRESAMQNGLQEMGEDEINEEIRLVKVEMKEKQRE